MRFTGDQKFPLKLSFAWQKLFVPQGKKGNFVNLTLKKNQTITSVYIAILRVRIVIVSEL